MNNPKGKHASGSPEHKYLPAVSNSPLEVFAGAGNLQGYLCENDDASDVYVSFYDAADAGDITLGVTAPAFTQKVAAEGAFGRDSNGFGYKYFTKGCFVAVVSSRNGSGAAATPAVLETWSSNK